MSQSGQNPPNQKTDGMCKSQLQELCQKRAWPLPEYHSTKEGPLHGPSFKANVLVNGLTFHSSGAFNRAKDAQIEAAKIALAHFSTEGTSSGSVINDSVPASRNCRIEGVSDTSSINLSKSKMDDEIRKLIVEEVTQTPEKMLETKSTEHAGELHIYKNRLQSFVMKKGYGVPMYTFEREGPPHSSRFKSKVIINGQEYESPRFFSTLKESEHAAAKVALLSLVPPESQEVVLDKSVFKNLLQELAQKSGKKLPIYSTTGSGASHMPTFVSTVFVDGEAFLGGDAKTKKLAEMNAAEAAYTCLNQRKSMDPSGCVSISAPKNISDSNLPACDTSIVGATSQLGTPSKLIVSPSDAGLLKSKSSGPSGCVSISAPKNISDSNLPACDTSNLGVTSQLGTPKLIVSPSDTGSLKSGNKGPKEIPSCLVATHANPKGITDQIFLSQGKGSSPIILSEASNASSPDSNSHRYPVSSSRRRYVVHTYPRKPNMEFPAGAVVQHTGDKWIAVKFAATHTGTGH